MGFRFTLGTRGNYMSLATLDLDKVTYFDLNNQLNIPKNNSIQLQKDTEALQAFIQENVKPNTKQFNSCLLYTSPSPRDA